VPDKQHNDCAQRRTDQSCALIMPILSHALANERGNEGPGDPDHHRHQEALGIVGTRQQEASDETGEKTDERDPDDARHFVL